MKTTPPSWRKSSTTLIAAIDLERSRRGIACYTLLFSALLAAPLLVFLDGYPLGAGAALLLALSLVSAGQRKRPVGLRCLAGQWQFRFRARGWVPVEILGPVHSPPWLLAFRWRAVDGMAGQGRPLGSAVRWLYLWPDSLQAEQWRQLRKLLRVAGTDAGSAGQG
ncbi:hypothetical protein FV139_06360 [Parahaliea maris]|uniref:Uncharacterized protein n=1 Tax=Parahaliea maris TaxID=2716870 RepID=A0A5C9A3Q0_9GAMM|nr:protein YgfX [Parahaliea maris]TXS95505.1 hypothetical protein FV139_06360 [Parahaliea maris]